MTDSTPTPDAPRVPEVAGGDAGAGTCAGGGLGGLLESAQQALSAQAQAAQQVVEGSAGGGVVSVTMTGSGEVTEVTLAPEVVDPGDIEMLQDLIVAALHDAGLKVTELQQQALGALGGLDLGGLGDMLGGGLTGGTGGARDAGADGAIDVGSHDPGDDDAGGGPDAGDDR
jgi:DNA-binding YbaB/EbfC family protein